MQLVRQEMQRLDQLQQHNEQQAPATTTLPINAISIDFYLWDYAKANAAAMQHIPIHKTSSIFY
jgi:hypothetical protein